MRIIIKYILKVLFRIKVTGQYESHHDKTLIIANHTSFIDGALLSLFLPVNPVFVINTDIAKNPLFKLFLKCVDFLLIDPSHPMSMKKIISLLESGRPVVLFPEGRITVTGSLMKVYSGAAFAATKTEATIIPVYITGAKYTYFSRLKGLFNRRLFPKLTINIFPSQKIESNNSIPTKERREDAKDKLHKIMMEMQVASQAKTTIFEMVLKGKDTHSKNHLLFEDRLTPNLDYGSLIKKSVALGTLLNKDGNLSKRIGLMLPNSNACVVTFYAMQYLGKIPAMLNYTAGSSAIKSALIATQSNTIITSHLFIEKAELGDLINELSETYKIIYLEDLRSEITNTDKAKIVFNQFFPDLTRAKSNFADEAVVLFTSGSEGAPKGVVHSHESILSNVYQLQSIYDMTPKDKFMICLPMFHVFGLTAMLLSLELGAGAFLYPNPLHYRTIPEIIYDCGCTILIGTSTFLAGYARFADQYDFHKVRYIIAGAEKLKDEVSEMYFEKFGIRIMEGYGATETAPVISANTPMLAKKYSVGRALPGINTRIEKVEGIKDGGKLIVAADNVMLGYLRVENPGVIERAATFNGKREYDTGDIVDIDTQGFLTIKGRAKRFAKIAGEMISLEIVEKIASACSNEFQHAVIVRDDEKKGEALVLFTTDASLVRKKLLEASRKLGFPELSVPRDIHIVKEIPVMSTGKTNYIQLQNLIKEKITDAADTVAAKISTIA